MRLHGDEKVAFNNVDAGIGFNAWRRVVVPIGPRSEAQLHRMHKPVRNPPTSKMPGGVLANLDKWEGQLTAYFKCGRPVVPDGTKVLIAMGVPLSSTNASVRLALMGINVYATSKDTLRENVRFREEHGQHLGSGDAHLLTDVALSSTLARRCRIGRK